ncbi:DNA polymerase III subunit delta [Sphingomonas profundi]|uniref:DNA polymerase III subunit delta n=1 Tax=Alterirhizorhabdus profundi TaxID=2681549 RepID=UPI0012E73A96|nr:DNA polymerase III subunit delta [Sphingomonas profundi]
MKANRAQVERALDGAGGEVRFVLLHGPDESQSRALADRLAQRFGGTAERIDLSGAALKADPARLADEAAAISLFGEPRFIRVEPAGDEAIDAIEALLESPAGGNPVVLVAGTLRKDSKLLKRALAEADVAAFASYLPEGGDADKLAWAIARDHGLRLEPEVAPMLAAATGGDRALLARELEKFACFLDASVDRPATLDTAALDALGADAGEGNLSRLVDHVLGGRGDQAAAEIGRLAVEGVEGIALLRPLLRRLLQLAAMRAQVEAGDSVESVMGGGAGRGVFWKDKAALSAQLSRWNAAKLAKAISRLGHAERAVKSSGSAGPLIVEAELLAIAREATRLR